MRVDHDRSRRAPSPWAARAFATAWGHLVPEDRLITSDALLCFGSRFPRVPDRAAALFHLGVAPLVVVTGGPAGPGEPPEADVMAAALEALGVPADRIVRERQARHTGENVTLGLDALAERTDVHTLTLVSWPLAARRCAATVARQRPEVRTASAPALRRPGWRWPATARRIGLALGELDRLDRYATDGHLVPVATPAEVRRATTVLRAELDGAVGGTRSTHRAPTPGLGTPGSTDEGRPTLLVSEG